MTMLRITHLLDDFSMGGVTKGLRVFEHSEIAAIAASTVKQVDPNAWSAPAVDADLILIHFPPRWRGLPFLASLRRRNPKARIIQVEHSYSEEWEALHVPNRARFRLMLKTAYHMVDAVVAVSQAQARWLIDAGSVSPDKVSVIYPHSCNPGLAAVPDLDHPMGQPVIVGSFGRFAEAKGYERLIEAFKSMDDKDDLRLVLGGVGPLEQELKARALGCGKIKIVGEVTDVAAFMRDIHVFAAPSHFEAFGQVATEARQAGRPLLVSTAGGLPEQVGDAGVVVNCDDADELLWALRELPMLPLAHMGATGRKDVVTCVERRVESWVELFSTLPKAYCLAA